MQFQVKTIKNENIKNELLKIGFDESYVDYASKKHDFLTVKIQNVPCHIATIIKETSLSKGADAGVNRGVLTHSVELSDVILSGTIKQLEEIIKGLSYQPFGLNKIAEEIKKEIELNKKEYSPKIMGILNVTEDSFSDGGKYLDTKDAINHAYEMVEGGADIIDIGAESTRPNAKPVDIDLEIKRLTPVVSEIKKAGITVSIDTRNSLTAQKMIELKADIINDVSGFDYDKNMVNVIKNSNAEIVIMHSKGTPETMDALAQYKNIEDEIYNALYQKIIFAQENGIPTDRIIIDTGFGFAKNIEQNFKLLSKIKEFNSLKVRHLAGVSRKRFLKSLSKTGGIEEIDGITMLSSFYLFQNKVDIIRVHDVKKTKLALEFYNSIYSQKPCP